MITTVLNTSHLTMRNQRPDRRFAFSPYSLTWVLYISAILLFFIMFYGCKKENNTLQDQSFVKFYNGYLSNKGYDVKQTADGGYILIGTATTINRGTDIYLAKTDQYGNQQWEPKYFGGGRNDNGYSLQIAQDGGYILAGSTDTVLNGQLTTKIYIVKTDEQGDTIWTKIIGGNKNDEAYFVQLNGNNGYLVTGYTESFGSGGKDAVLVSLDLNGNINWIRTYGGSADDIAKCVQVTADGYVLTGSTQFTAQSATNIFLIKTNNIGLIEQTATIGGIDSITGEYIQVLPDGGFIGVGTKLSNGSSYSTIYLFKLGNDINNLLWSKEFGGSARGDEGKSVQLTSDSGFAIIGTHHISDNSSNFYFIKTDSQGNELFSRNYGQSGLQQAGNIEQTADSGFVIIGTNNIDGYNVMTLIKVKPNGELN